MLAVLRTLHRQAKDAAEAKAPIPELGDVGYVDASGVVLLPDEVAELRGDPVRAVLAESMTPVVVVYSDGERMLWPDEYAADTPRPEIGSEADDEHGNAVRVVELLHHATGEPIGEPAPPVPADVPEADVVPLAAVPDLPPVPGDWEDPDPVDETTPRPGDFVFVNVGIAELRRRLAEELDDVTVARRLLAAEKAGRGINAKPRQAAVKAIEETIARLSSGGES